MNFKECLKHDFRKKQHLFRSVNIYLYISCFIFNQIVFKTILLAYPKK